MKAMVLNGVADLKRNRQPLELTDMALPVPGEKEILVKVTRLATEIPLRPEIQEYALDEANRALLELKERKIRGAKILRIQ